MHVTFTIELLLWCIVGFAGTGMGLFLLFGWFKGIHYEKEQLLRRR